MPGITVEEGQVRRGMALVMLSRPEEAVAAFDEALAREPGHLVALLGRAEALAALDRLDEAAATLGRCAGAPYPDVAVLSAWVAAKRGRLEEMESDLLLVSLRTCGEAYLAPHRRFLRAFLEREAPGARTGDPETSRA